MVSRAYYACAYVAVILFWISASFRFISATGGANSPVAILLVLLIGIVLPSGAVLSAVGAYWGILKGRIWLALFALLASAFIALQIDIRTRPGRYLSVSDAEFYSLLLVGMLVSHVALIIRSPVEKVVEDQAQQDET